MSGYESKFQSCDRISVEAKGNRWSVRTPHHWHNLRRWMPATLVVILVILLQAVPASAQATPTPTPTPIANPCPDVMTGQSLYPVPEIASNGGKLRGTILLGDEQEWMSFRVPTSAPTATSRSQCLPQYVRTFRELGAVPTMASAPSGPYSSGSYALPRPGPTLRARVGELVQLTFLNQINPSNFGNSLDRGEIGACDESSAGYPGTPPSGDKFPDCFHGSSTGNIHFHGTHTNPGSTGDNVFIEVRPSPRDDNKPTVTLDSVKKSFDAFFEKCEMKLNRSQLDQWPKIWDDLPDSYTDDQKKLLKQYDAQLEKKYPGAAANKQFLWPVNEKQLKEGAWPQYYIGAFPFCFRLPEYKAPTWPPPASSMAGMTMGTSTADHMADARVLQMGQSPGTHWYHAHKHGSTAINVANGMTGAFIIEGQYDDDLNNWYGYGWTRTQPVLVINQLGVTPNLLRQTAAGGGPGPGQIDKGPDFSVNGQLKPVITMQPGEVQMWRIVNTSGRAGSYFVGPPSGFQWMQLAQDGVQFHDSNYKSHLNKSFLLAPGNRADLLVKAPGAPCTNPKGCTFPVIVQNEVDPSDLTTAAKMTLVTVNVAGTPLDPTSKNANFIPTAPKPPAFLDDITSSEVTGTKTIVFASTPPFGMPTPAMHTINGEKFDGEVGAVVLLNKVEEWKIVNQTYAAPISHPFHIHINPFQVVEVFEPNAPLIDPKTGKAPINPKTKKPYIDPQTKKVATKYAFHPTNLAPGQCYLNPDRPDTWKPCASARQEPQKNLIWWDTFPIPTGYAPTTDAAGQNPLLNSQGQPVQVPGYFKMRSRFVDYTGYYVIHCHILAHEDRGMMTVVEVAPSQSPYSHK